MPQADGHSVLPTRSACTVGMRHAEVGMRMHGVSQRMLTRTLRRHERDGLVLRPDFEEPPLESSTSFLTRAWTCSFAWSRCGPGWSRMRTASRRRGRISTYRNSTKTHSVGCLRKSTRLWGEPRRLDHRGLQRQGAALGAGLPAHPRIRIPTRSAIGSVLMIPIQSMGFSNPAVSSSMARLVAWEDCMFSLSPSCQKEPLVERPSAIARAFNRDQIIHFENSFEEC